MAVNVYSETYRDADDGYVVSVSVTFEPKTSLYDVSITVGEVLVERACFTDRKTACIYAVTGLNELWTDRMESPVSIITQLDNPEPLDLGPACPECADRGCNRCDDTGRAMAAFVLEL